LPVSRAFRSPRKRTLFGAEQSGNPGGCLAFRRLFGKAKSFNLSQPSNPFLAGAKFRQDMAFFFSQKEKNLDCSRFFLIVRWSG